MDKKEPGNVERVRMFPIDEVIAFEGNVKDHPPTQIRKVANSIVQYGWDQPIVVDEHMIIIKGHCRLLAAKEIGFEEVPVVINKDLTEVEVRMARIADNKVAESEWDVDLLWEEVTKSTDEGLDFADMGFDKNSLRRRFAEKDLEKIGVMEKDLVSRKEEYALRDDHHDDPTLPQVEAFITPFRGEEAYYRKMTMVDYLNTHDKILIGFSGGKDSVHEDSKMWFRVDGQVHYTTPAILLDELIHIKHQVENDGQVIVTPVEEVETLMPTSMYQREAKIDFGKINYIMYHLTDKPMYAVRTHRNTEVLVTEDHSLVRVGPSNSKGLRIQEQETLTKDIKIGDRLPSVNFYDFATDEIEGISDVLLRLCGLWIADGCYAVDRKIVMSTGNNSDIISFLEKIPRPLTKEEKVRDMLQVVRSSFSTQKEAVKYIASSLEVSRSCVLNVIYRGIPENTLGGKLKGKFINVTVKDNGDAWICCKPLVERMRGLGFVGKCRTKYIPDWLFVASRRQIGIFLAGYFDGDGCLHKKGVSAASVNYNLLCQVRVLLKRVGVASGVSEASGGLGGFAVSEQSRCSQLCIEGSQGIREFKKWVPCFKRHKTERDQGDPLQSKNSFAASGVKSLILLPQKERRVFDFETEDANHLFIAEDIVVHNSLGALLWCLEHCERDKIVPYYSNLAWGPDWPHGIAFVKYLEKKLDIEIFTCGSSDPGAPGRFEDLLLQHGYMDSQSCWYRNYVKIKNIRAFIHQEKYHPLYGCNSVQILAVRWQESPDRALKYPDRGILKRDRIHFASPHVQWTDADLLWYLDARGIKLHTAYQHSPRMGCLVCPNESKRGCINSRKKFPKLWRLMLDWHGRGARRRGRLQKYHFVRAVSSLEDLVDEDIAQLRGPYGEIALGSKEFEDYIEEGLGISLPVRPYLTVPFDPEFHNFRNDLKPGAFEDPNVILDSTCELSG